MYKLHSKRCTNSEHPKRDLSIFKCQQVLSAFDVANKTSKKKKKIEICWIFSRKVNKRNVFSFSHLCKILPKKKLVSK